jgi:DNA-binding LytR/AlgR family response regulator
MSNVITTRASEQAMRKMSFRHTEGSTTQAFASRKEPSLTSMNLTTQLQELLQLLGTEKKQEPEYRNRFLVRRGHQFIPVPVSDIRYFYSKDKLCFARTHDNKEYMLSFTITEIEEMISPALFFRASRKYMVSHAAITKILVWFNGKLKVEIEPGATESIVISRERVNSFKTWLGE